MYVVYTALAFLALLLSAPWWLVQMARTGKYRAGLRERFGRVPQRVRGEAGVVWIHAVSVGELLAITRVVEQLRAREPGRRVVISTTTATGQALARQRFGESNVFYFPVDLPFAIWPYLRVLRPDLLVVAETEFWPNFLRLAKAAGAQIAVVNARISDRSFPRYRRWHGLLKKVLQNVDLLLAQSEEDARRLREIGAEARRVHVAGNLKFDVAPPKSSAAVQEIGTSLRAGGAAPVIVCGSTLEGEEELVLRAFSAVLGQHPKAALILAPRHPERFPQVADLVKGTGLALRRRSERNAAIGIAGSVLLLDTMGELAAVYQLGDVAFVGGSLVPRGGHNIVEPAHYGIATLVGPHTHNFRDMVEIFRRADALRVVTADTLTAELLRLLADDGERKALGERARQVAGTNQGSTERTVECLVNLLRRRTVERAVAMPETSR
jgi:3-deoxy-D-manno-octulosonic-acid transferase